MKTKRSYNDDIVQILEEKISFQKEKNRYKIGGTKKWINEVNRYVSFSLTYAHHECNMNTNDNGGNATKTSSLTMQ